MAVGAGWETERSQARGRLNSRICLRQIDAQLVAGQMRVTDRRKVDGRKGRIV